MRGLRHCILALAAGGAMLCCASVRDRGAKDMPSTVVYTSTIADDRAATTLTVKPDGTGQLTVGSNRDRRAEPVGRFEAAVPGALLRRLRSSVASAAFEAVQSEAGFLSGDPYRRIRVVSESGAELAVTVGAGANKPAAFLEAEQAVLAILQDLLTHPSLAMTMTVSGLPPRVEPGGALLDVILRNVGRMPFRLTAPSQWGKAEVNCELSAVRDVPESQLTLNDQKFAQLGAQEFVAASKPPADGFLSLEPGEGVAVRFRYAFPWPPAPYRLDVTLSVALNGPDGARLFDGNLVAGPYRTEVPLR